MLYPPALKVFRLAPARESFAELGYPPSVILWIGLVEVACLALYLVPRTAPLAAILWTGYLGGAIATHVRLANPLFSHTLFPIYVAILLWLPLWLRDARVRSLLGEWEVPGFPSRRNHPASPEAGASRSQHGRSH